ncbi:isoamylase early set domain-containing protein [Meiothermus cerbereus]|jgi:hypothetical protein|uniref:isoamylase early set domain-containing protein n=1 Tax=Meiothermus cerbereus TaxID=65552 RepID=UPI0006855809|nr:isoamylase early set domain-containing protein [Meiothermus cerbereus]
MVELQPIDERRWRAIFVLPKGITAHKAAVVGDFLDESWHPDGVHMVCGSDGCWRASLELEAGQSYQFRYLVDECCWYNDDGCPLVRNPFGSFNNLLVVPEQEGMPLPLLERSIERMTPPQS